MSSPSPAYQHAPRLPRPVALYLAPDAHPTSLAEELVELRLALPDWLWAGERWACWRYQWDAGRVAWTKCPLDPLSPGRHARANGPGTWSTLDQAVSFRRHYGADGLLRALVDGEGLLAVDLDGVRDPLTGELSALGRSTLADLAGYAEVSPSGAGLHVWLREPFPEGGRQGRRQGQIEVYSGSRLMSVTGRVVRRAQ